MYLKCGGVFTTVLQVYCWVCHETIL